MGAQTAYEVGVEYAEQVHMDGVVSGAVNIDAMLVSTQDLPDGDYQWMVDNGVDPNAREYWRGYNAKMAELT
jgi:hypothetical protein